MFVFVGGARMGISELYTIRDNGTGYRKVTRNTARRAEIQPEWSPDGTRIAFARTEACRVVLHSCFAIWTVNADGSDLRRLTSAKVRIGRHLHPLDSLAPTWSPDGKRIAYERVLHPSRDSDIWVMNADGTHKRRLTRLRSAESPAWSPDGERIAFSAGSWQDIFVLDVRDCSVRRLFTTKRLGEDLPDWSPDGKRIAYEQNNDNDYEVFVTNADGKNRRNVSRDPAIDSNPVWSPDGTEIAFGSDRDQDVEVAIFIVSPDAAGEPRKVIGPDMDSYDIDWAAPPTGG